MYPLFFGINEIFKKWKSYEWQIFQRKVWFLFNPLPGHSFFLKLFHVTALIIESVLKTVKTGKRSEIRKELFLVTYFKVPVKRIFVKELRWQVLIFTGLMSSYA